MIKKLFIIVLYIIILSGCFLTEQKHPPINLVTVTPTPLFSPTDEIKTVTVTHHTGDFSLQYSLPRQNIFPCDGVTFAEDGQTYLCSHRVQTDTGLWLGTLDKGLIKPIWKPAKTVSRYAWTPDASAIVFADMAGKVGADEPLYVFRIADKITASLGLSYKGYFEFAPTSEFLYLPKGVWKTAQLVITPAIKLEQETVMKRIVPEIQDALYNRQIKIVKTSPNGEYMAFVEVKYYRDSPLLTIINRKTNQSTLVSDQIEGRLIEGSNFSWSPDSQTLAYSIMPPNSRSGKLMLVAADGSQSRLLAETSDWAYYNSLYWLPSGKGLIYSLTPSSGINTWLASDVYVISADGGESHRLLEGEVNLGLMAKGRFLWLYREHYDETTRIFTSGMWFVKLSYQDLK